jgi:hypothetical protein
LRNTMPKKNSRYHRGFDGLSKKAYPYLIPYQTEEQAREAIPSIARTLNLSKQTLGAYLGQLKRNKKVYEFLMQMGFTERQIPAWVKRPEQPVQTPKQVQPTPQPAPPESRPQEYAYVKSEKKEPPKSELDRIMDLLPENGIYWLSQGKYERNPDLSKYKIEYVNINGTISNNQGVKYPNTQPTKKQPTAEEIKKQEEARKEKLRKEAEDEEFRTMMTIYLYNQSNDPLFRTYLIAWYYKQL